MVTRKSYIRALNPATISYRSSGAGCSRKQGDKRFSTALQRLITAKRNATVKIIEQLPKEIHMAKPNPTDNKYSRDHEWAKDNGDGTITMGISDYAQEQLTDIVFVELPVIGKKVQKGEPVAVVESVKSVSDIYSPVTGEVVEAHQDLEASPELINQDAFGEGWICKIRMDNPSELEDLMDAAAYDAFIQGLAH